MFATARLHCRRAAGQQAAHRQSIWILFKHDSARHGTTPPPLKDPTGCIRCVPYPPCTRTCLRHPLGTSCCPRRVQGDTPAAPPLSPLTAAADDPDLTRQTLALYCCHQLQVRRETQRNKQSVNEYIAADSSSRRTKSRPALLPSAAGTYRNTIGQSSSEGDHASQCVLRQGHCCSMWHASS